MKNTSRDRSGKQVVKVVSGEKALGYLEFKGTVPEEEYNG